MPDTAAAIIVCTIVAIIGIIDRWTVRKGRK